jgi:hypothetical protein
MRNPLPALLTTALLGTIPVQAQDACPCVPLTHLWIVKTCANWTDASTELLLANGDPQVIALPVGMNDPRWLIVRRFVSGAAIDVSADPFHLEQFDGMTRAITRLYELTPGHRPMILTAPDGQMLIISLKEPEPRRRAVGH